MIGKRAIVTLLICLLLTMLPMAAVAEEEEPSDGDTGAPKPPMPMWDMWCPERGHFNYSEGKVVGNYLTFGINDSTGVVTDYTVTVSTFDPLYQILIYEEVCCNDESGEIAMEEIFPEYNLTYENVTVFESIETQGFTPVGHPGTFADLFIFQGERVLTMFYDRDWSQGYYMSGEDNVTIIFTVTEGLEISEFPYYWGCYEDDEWCGEGEKPIGDPDFREDDIYWEPMWNEIWIESNNTITTILINSGNATIENNTITVVLYANSDLEISTWAQIPFFPIIDELWYDEPEFEDEMALIKDAKDEGIIAGEGWYLEGIGQDLYLEGDMARTCDNSDFNSYNDPTFDMDFIYIGDERLDIQIDSEIPEGRIVMVNLDDEALEAHSIEDLLVKLDGDQIEPTATLEELMAQVDSTEAKFFAIFSDKGTTVFVYVPHFSTHTISIASLLGAGGLDTLSNIVVPAITAAILIAAMALVVGLRGRKGQDEF